MKTSNNSVISGFLWSFIENITTKGVSFIVGILLARILLPSEFGLIGMVTFFIAISSAFVDSGFSQAIINKDKISQVDCNTAFAFNIVVAVICYLVLFFLAPNIAFFYGEKELKLIIRVLGLILIINSLTIISRSLLIKQLAFKKQMYISLCSNIISGIISILMAYNNWGVWSLVFQQISYHLISALMFFGYVKWMPSFYFSKNSFVYLYKYGFNLLVSGVLFTVFNNLYYVIIGKYHSVTSLGYYTRSEQFNDVASRNITNIVQRVTFPALSKLQRDRKAMSKLFIKIFQNTTFISIPLILALAALSEPLILLLLGEKWEGSIWMLKMLCFSGLFHPFINLNLNIFKVVSNTALFMKLEIFRNVFLNIINIILGIFLGIKSLLIGYIIISCISFIVNSFYSSKYTTYSFLSQLKDMITPLVLGFILYYILMFISSLFLSVTLYSFTIQLLFCILYFFFTLRVFKPNIYRYFNKLFI